MNYRIWNKTEKINNIDAQYFIDNLKIRDTDGVFLIVDNFNEVQSIEIDRIIKSVYKLNSNLTTNQVATEYIRIHKEQEEQAISKQLSLEEAHNKISILQAENADLLLDSAVKDLKIQSIEKDLADLTLEVIKGVI